MYECISTEKCSIMWVVSHRIFLCYASIFTVLPPFSFLIGLLTSPSLLCPFFLQRGFKIMQDDLLLWSRTVHNRYRFLQAWVWANYPNTSDAIRQNRHAFTSWKEVENLKGMQAPPLVDTVFPSKSLIIWGGSTPFAGNRQHISTAWVCQLCTTLLLPINKLTLLEITW